MSLELINSGGCTAACITRTADQTRSGDANLLAAASRFAVHSRIGRFRANMPMTNNFPSSESASILLKPRNRWVSLLFIVLLLGPGLGLTAVAAPKYDGVSTTLAGIAKLGGPVANPEQEEHSLPQ